MTKPSFPLQIASLNFGLLMRSAWVQCLGNHVPRCGKYYHIAKTCCPHALPPMLCDRVLARARDAGWIAREAELNLVLTTDDKNAAHNSRRCSQLQ
jgi:hypothetical protein